MAAKFKDADEAVQALTDVSEKVHASKKLLVEALAPKGYDTIREYLDGELDGLVESLDWFAAALVEAHDVTDAAPKPKSGQTQTSASGRKTSSANGSNKGRSTGGKVTATSAAPSKAGKRTANAKHDVAPPASGDRVKVAA
jgi:hypothetical protein